MIMPYLYSLKSTTRILIVSRETFIDNQKLSIFTYSFLIQKIL